MGSAHLTSQKGPWTQSESMGLHDDTCTHQDMGTLCCAGTAGWVQGNGGCLPGSDLLPNRRPDRARPAACVAGELKLVPGQFGMPSLVTCLPEPFSVHMPLCKQSLLTAHFHRHLVHGT